MLKFHSPQLFDLIRNSHFATFLGNKVCIPDLFPDHYSYCVLVVPSLVETSATEKRGIAPLAPRKTGKRKLPVED